MALCLPRDRVRAPEIGGTAGWLNIDHSLSLATLRGKMTLLDFLTACYNEGRCIQPCGAVYADGIYHPLRQ